MELTIRSRAGIALDLEGEAASVPDIDNMDPKIWWSFRVHRKPRLRIHPEGSMQCADRYKPWFKFAVIRPTFENAMSRAWDMCHAKKDFTGHVIFFQRRHPERRIFVPRDILYDMRARSMRAYRNYDTRGAAVVLTANFNR